MQKKIIPPAAAAILAWNKFRELNIHFQIMISFYNLSEKNIYLVKQGGQKETEHNGWHCIGHHEGENQAQVCVDQHISKLK